MCTRKFAGVPSDKGQSEHIDKITTELFDILSDVRDFSGLLVDSEDDGITKGPSARSSSSQEPGGVRLPEVEPGGGPLPEGEGGEEEKKRPGPADNDERRSSSSQDSGERPLAEGEGVGEQEKRQNLADNDERWLWKFLWKSREFENDATEQILALAAGKTNEELGPAYEKLRKLHENWYKLIHKHLMHVTEVVRTVKKRSQSSKFICFVRCSGTRPTYGFIHRRSGPARYKTKVTGQYMQRGTKTFLEDIRKEIDHFRLIMPKKETKKTDNRTALWIWLQNLEKLWSWVQELEDLLKKGEELQDIAEPLKQHQDQRHALKKEMGSKANPSEGEAASLRMEQDQQTGPGKDSAGDTKSQRNYNASRILVCYLRKVQARWYWMIKEHATRFIPAYRKALNRYKSSVFPNLAHCPENQHILDLVGLSLQGGKECLVEAFTYDGKPDPIQFENWETDLVVSLDYDITDGFLVASSKSHKDWFEENNIKMKAGADWYHANESSKSPKNWFEENNIKMKAVADHLSGNALDWYHANESEIKGIFPHQLLLALRRQFVFGHRLNDISEHSAIGPKIIADEERTMRRLIVIRTERLNKSESDQKKELKESIDRALKQSGSSSQAEEPHELYEGHRSPDVFRYWVRNMQTFLDFHKIECGQHKVLIAKEFLRGKAADWYDNLHEAKKNFWDFVQFEKALQVEFVLRQTLLDVSDKTCYRTYFSLMTSTATACIDSFFWCTLNCAVFSVFLGLVWVWWGVTIALDIFGGVGHYFGGCFLRKTGFLSFRGDGLWLSAVTFMTPDLYPAYAETMRLDNQSLYTKLSPNPNPKRTLGFEFQLAEFFLHLCALSYEPNDVVVQTLASWDPDLEFQRFGHRGCCILAVWHFKQNFVVLTFKGTSPVDLSEWLTDFTLRKSAPRNGVLPGLVHTGFYSALGLPDVEVVKSYDLHTLAKLKQSTSERPYLPFDLRNKDRKNFWATGLLHNLLALSNRFRTLSKDGSQDPPSLWITGHSLGAATATLFTAMLLWRRTSLGKASPVPNLDWDALFTLQGTYTYGTPRTGDTDFREAITSVIEDTGNWYTPKGKPKYQFYRIINANDPVCTVPLGPMSLFGSFYGKKSPITDASSISHPRLTLLDFQHLGRPVHIHFRTGTHYPQERSLPFVGFTYVWQLLTSVHCAFKATTVNEKLFQLIAGMFPVSPIGMIRDHLPSEYIRNLKEAWLRETQRIIQTQPEESLGARTGC